MKNKDPIKKKPKTPPTTKKPNIKDEDIPVAVFWPPLEDWE